MRPVGSLHSIFLLYLNAKYLHVHVIGPNHVTLCSLIHYSHLLSNNALTVPSMEALLTIVPFQRALFDESSSRRRQSRLINIRDVYDHADAEFMYCG